MAQRVFIEVIEVPNSHQRKGRRYSRGIVRIMTDREAEIAAEFEHIRILLEHDPGEPGQAALAGDIDKALHEHPTNTMSLPVASHHHGEFSLARCWIR